MRIDKSSNDKRFDQNALYPVSRSTFAPQIYRCAPVTGNFIFLVEFTRQ
jgi:outer membrane biosynthesis protein TonB